MIKKLVLAFLFTLLVSSVSAIDDPSISITSASGDLDVNDVDYDVSADITFDDYDPDSNAPYLDFVRLKVIVQDEDGTIKGTVHTEEERCTDRNDEVSFSWSKGSTVSGINIEEGDQALAVVQATSTSGNNADCIRTYSDAEYRGASSQDFDTVSSSDLDKEPNANFEYTPSESSIGQNSVVLLDGSDSNDPDGSITSYSWSGDLEILRKDGPHAVARAPEETGLASITLQVTDDAGQTHASGKSVEVSPSNYHEDIAAGKYLYVSQNWPEPYPAEEDIKHFFWGLSNQKWSSSPSINKPGSIIIREKDGFMDSDDRFIFKTNPGIVNQSRSLKDIVPTRIDGSISQVKEEAIIASKGDKCYNGAKATPCNLITKKFFTQSNEEKIVSDDKTPSGISQSSFTYLGKAQGNHYFEDYGQLAVGYSPKVVGNPDMNGEKRFFICRVSGHEDSEDTDGIVIDMAPKEYGPQGSITTEPNLYKCDSQYNPDSDQRADWRGEESGIWRQVDACNDGIDNDADGGIDVDGGPNSNNDDPQCGSSTENSEKSLSGGSQCSHPAPQVAVLDLPDRGETKGVLHQSDPTGEWHRNTSGACTYNNFDTDVPVPDKEANAFTCFDSRTENRDYYRFGGSLPDNQRDNFNYCNDLLSSWPEGHPDNISAVEYYVNKSAIPTGKNKFAEEYGFKNEFFQNIHDAEDKWAPDCNDVFGRLYCKSLSRDEISDASFFHNNQTWSKYNIKDLTDGPYNHKGTSYDGYAPSPEEDGDTNVLNQAYYKNSVDYLDSWVVANGSTDNKYINSKEDATVREGDSVGSAAFPGGFAPKCEDAEESEYGWTYIDGEWQCGYPPSGNGELEVNFFDIGKNNYVGFQINWTEINDAWRSAYPTDPYSDTEDSEHPAGPVKVRSQCWIGNADNRPADVNQDVVNLTQKVQQGEPVQIASKAPERPHANAASYTCLFGFKQLLHYDATHNKEVTITTTIGDGDTSTSGETHYFMAGTNTDRSPIIFESGTQLKKSENQLDSYKQQTSNMTIGADPFTNFPFEPLVQGEDPEDVRIWHPVQYHCNVAYPGTC